MYFRITSEYMTLLQNICLITGLLKPKSVMRYTSKSSSPRYIYYTIQACNILQPSSTRLFKKAFRVSFCIRFWIDDRVMYN